jgi:hypothetical protein
MLYIVMTEIADPYNKSYRKMVPYRDEHKAQLEAIKDAHKTTLPNRKYIIKCDCGKEITLHNLIIHYCGKKHRAICGDLPPVSSGTGE